MENTAPPSTGTAAGCRVASLLVAPDFPPEHLSGWHVFNTALQRCTGNAIRLLTPTSTEEMHAAIEGGTADLIYANPFDAALLVRQRGYVPVVKPLQKADEMLIAASASSGLHKHTELRAGMHIAVTDNKDVRLIGLRLLEAANLSEADLHWIDAPSFQAAARMVLQGKADAAFFLASSFHALSALTKGQMSVLLESRIRDITHVLLLHPSHQASCQRQLQQFITGMKNDAAGQKVLNDLDMPAGFAELSQEETEFMIDLMETLMD